MLRLLNQKSVIGAAVIGARVGRYVPVMLVASSK
jgi:hypothetical protein